MNGLLLRYRRSASGAVVVVLGLWVTAGMFPDNGVFARDDAPSADTAKLSGEDVDLITLQQLMDRMSSNFSRLKRTVRDAEQRDATLECLIDMQRITIAARQRQPHLQDVPEDQKAAYLLDYQVRLIGLNEALLNAERAVLEGRTTDAFDTVKQMAVLQREGHEKFKVDD